MGKKVGLWLLALGFTVVSAVWQRTSGPTRPVRGEASLGGQAIHLILDRSHAGSGDFPVRLGVPDPAIEGEIAWRRYPTAEPWRTVPMRREGDRLAAEIPHQPPAAKVEYEVRLARGGERIRFPERPVIARFKGSVPLAVLVPHIAAMFLGMILSTRAGLEALTREGRLRGLVLAALGCFVLGGLVLGPVVQKAAFGSFWTGVPFGYDLTDNKTLVTVLVWGWAAWRQRGGRSSRATIVTAAVLTLVVFAIPHSAWGSELRWQGPGPSQAPAAALPAQ